MSGLLSNVVKPTTRLMLLSLPLLLTGCSTLSSSLNPFASRNTDPDDPLANLPTKPTDGYKDAQRNLKDPEGTTLVFAGLKEENREFEQARVAYTNILAANPDCVEARNGLARVESQTGRVDQAVAILKATIRKYPDDPKAWFELGTVQAERREWPQSIKSFESALKRTTNDQMTLALRYQLGIALAQNNQIEEAQNHLRYAVGESAAMFNIGFVLNQAGQKYEAQQWLRRALNSHPDERTRVAASRMLTRLSGNVAIADSGPGQSTEPSQITRSSFDQMKIVPQAAPEGGVTWQEETTPVSHTQRPTHSQGVSVQRATMSRVQGVRQTQGIPNWNGGQQAMGVHVNPASQTTVQPRQWNPGP